MSLSHIVLGLLVALLWGVNFVAVKIGLQQFPPILFMAMRFAVVALCLIPWMGKPKLPLKTLLFMALSYGTAYHGLLFTGVYQGISIASSIIAIQLNVPFTALLSYLVYREPLGWQRAMGMIIAFAGVVCLVGSPDIGLHPMAFFMVVGAAFFWAVFNVHLKKIGPTSVMSLLGWVSVFTVPMLLSISLLVERPDLAHFAAHLTVPALGGLLYTSLLSTVVGFGLWSYLLRFHSVNHIAPFSLLMPLFGIVASVYFLDEHLSLYGWLGGTLTIIGVALVVSHSRKRDVKGAAVN
jgi:O-acetylserine/cysteine efflux transporter